MHIDPLVWKHYRNKTLNRKTIQEAQALTIALKVVPAALAKAILYELAYAEARREAERYFNHLLRIERFKKTRRWPAV